MGEPTLEDYLRHSTLRLEKEAQLNEQYQPNKKLKRLGRSSWPQYGFYFERSGQGSGVSYRVDAGKVCQSAKKTHKANDFYF